MKNDLMDHARTEGRLERGDGTSLAFLEMRVIPFESRISDQSETLSDALESLQRLKPDRAVVGRMPFFTGRSHEEIAAKIGALVVTATREWGGVRSWRENQIGSESD